MVYNFKMSRIDPESLPCSCSQLLHDHPDLQLVHGHIAHSASFLSVSRELYPYFQSLHQGRVQRSFGQQGFLIICV